MELSPIFLPKLTLPLRTQRLVCVPALAGLTMAQRWLCVPWAPGAADGLGRVAAQCWHCLWPPRLPWGYRQGMLAVPPLHLPGAQSCCADPGCPHGPLAPAGTCPLAAHPLQAGRRIHPKSTCSCLDGAAPTSAFGICTAAMWLRERSVGSPHSSGVLVLLPQDRGWSPLESV